MGEDADKVGTRCAVGDDGSRLDGGGLCGRSRSHGEEGNGVEEHLDDLCMCGVEWVWWIEDVRGWLEKKKHAQSKSKEKDADRLGCGDEKPKSVGRQASAADRGKRAGEEEEEQRAQRQRQ